MSLNRFHKTNDFDAIIIVKAFHLNWAKPTIQLRLLTKDRTEIMMHGVDEAHNMLKDVEPLRAFSFSIPGSCIKLNKAQDKHGVTGDYEVRLQYKIKVEIAKKILAQTNQLQFY